MKTRLPLAGPAARLNKVGYLPVELRNTELLRKFHQVFSQALENLDGIQTYNQDGKISSPGERVYNWLYSDVENRFPKISNIRDEIASILDQYYGTSWHTVKVTAWRNRFVEPEVLAAGHYPYSVLWHNDHWPSDTLGFFILLGPTGLGDGPLHYFCKEESRRIISNGFIDRHDPGLNLDGEDFANQRHVLVGDVGDALLVDPTTCLHRAGVPEAPNHRDILEFVFQAGPSQ